MNKQIDGLKTLPKIFFLLHHLYIVANITFVMWGLGGAGGELVIYKIADQLAMEGHTVNLVSTVGWNYSGYNPTDMQMYLHKGNFYVLSFQYSFF
jgi:hypothetical protein